MSEKVTTRVFNQSSLTLIVVARSNAEPRGQHFLLAPNCESREDYDVVCFYTRDGELVDGCAAWNVEGAGAAHVYEEAPTRPGGEPVWRLYALKCEPLNEKPSDLPSHLQTWATREHENWVTVLGAGIAGLSAAHELIERGFSVQVIEKSHTSPIDLDDDETARSGASTKAFASGLDQPDVGGVARTQWATMPLQQSGASGLELEDSVEFQPAPAGLAGITIVASSATTTESVRSIHGDGHWFGNSFGALADSAGFSVPFARDVAVGGGALAAEILSWLRSLRGVEHRSIVGLQLAMIVYRSGPDGVRDAAGRPRAADRLRAFLKFLESNDARELKRTLAHLRAFPVARIEADWPDGATENKYPGLIVRHHEQLGMVAGEHGFRFFPGFYRHLRDVMKRTPIFDPNTGAFTPRTVHDNLTEVEWQVVAERNRDYPAAFSRKAIKTIGGMLEQYFILRRDLNYRPSDMLRFVLRLARYMTSSSERRRLLFEDMTWQDYLTRRRFDRVADPEHNELPYGPRFRQTLLGSPQALVAMAAQNADTRTQGNISVQLAMDEFDLHESTDSTLNGPTSEQWLQHWKRYLEQQGVRFFVGDVVSISAAPNEPAEVEIVFPCATGKPAGYLSPNEIVDTERKVKHFYLCALDIAALARVTRELRQDSRFTYRGVLDGVSRLVQDDDHVDRDIEQIDRIGAETGDRFQTLTGIQLYYRERVAFENGHIYFAQSPWGLSAVSQVQYWGPFGRAGRDTRLLGNLSIDIGAWRAAGREPDPNQLARDKIAEHVKTQIKECLGDVTANGPKPYFYHLDDYIQLKYDNGLKPGWNRAPFLINVAGDWKNRPDGEPWSPTDDTNRRRHQAGDGMYIRGFDADGRPLPTADRSVWMHRDGGYLVHFGNLLFAGTHMRTFTRLGTMESANESARHAVNALLDYLNAGAPSAGSGRPVVDRERLLNNLGSAKVATRFGDYCDIWDPETNEFQDLDFLRSVDAEMMRRAHCDEDAPPKRTPSWPAPYTPAKDPKFVPHIFDLLRIDELPDQLDTDDDAVTVFHMLDSFFSAASKLGRNDTNSVLSMVEHYRKKFVDLLAGKKR